MEIFGKNKSRFTRIRPRIVLTFSILSMVILAIISFVVNFQTSNFSVKDQKERLLSLTDERATHIQTLLNNQKGLVLNFAASQVFRDFLVDTTITNYDSAKENLDRTIIANKNVSEFFVLDSSGKVVLTIGKTPLNTDKSQDDYFVNAKKDAYIKGPYNSKTVGETNYTISAPITNNQTNQLEGVVVARFKLDNLYAITENRIGLGKTSESFLINSDLYFISPSYYLDKDAIFTKKDDAQNARDCYQQKEVNEITKDGYANLKPEDRVLEYNDYRNVAILGTHAYIPETGWCLIGKIDQKEVFGPINNITWTIIIVGLLALIIIAITSYILAARITKPIEDIHKGTEKIAGGDLNYKVATNTQDEVGQLSRELDNMTEKIKQSRAEVDKKVLEQTGQITEKAKDMEDQQKAILNILEDVELEKDITAKEKDKINTILQNIGDAVFVVNKEKEIVLTNKVTVNLCGYTQEEIIGKNYKDVLKFVFEDTGKINDLFINKVFETKAIQEMSNHTVLINKVGDKIPVNDSAAPLLGENGEVQGCVVVFRDVTKERQIDQAKTEFVSLASHQLRTPLSAINWYSEMLLNGDVGKLTANQTKYLQEVYKGNQRMVNLVNTLLDVSRIELGTFAIEPKNIKIQEFATDIVNEIKHDAQEKKIEIKTVYDKKLPEIMADPKLIQIIIQNLLSNAVKYTPEKGQVSLTITKKDPNILIEVKDTGYGIPKNQHSQIFTKLFRADNVRVKDTEGTGLGLYIVKAIIDQSGGSILFQSEENKGTTFFVSLPLAGMPKKEGTKALEDIK